MTKEELEAYDPGKEFLGCCGSILCTIVFAGMAVGGFYGLAWLLAMFLRLVASFR